MRMSQKRNKIIIWVVVALLAVFLLILLTKVKTSPFGLRENKLVSQCEAQLEKQNTDFQVCKIEKNNLNFVSQGNLDKAIRPADELIVSLDVAKLLSKSQENTLTSKTIQKISSDEPSSLCFVMYPVFVPSHFQKYSSAEETKIALRQYLNEFQWKAITSLRLHSLKKGSNVACTESFKIGNLKNSNKLVSFILSLPDSSFFQKGIIDGDLHQYGVKVLLANKRFVNNQLSGMNIEDNVLQNSRQMIPLAIYKHWINFINAK